MPAMTAAIASRCALAASAAAAASCGRTAHRRWRPFPNPRPGRSRASSPVPRGPLRPRRRPRALPGARPPSLILRNGRRLCAALPAVPLARRRRSDPVEIFKLIDQDTKCTSLSVLYTLVRGRCAASISRTSACDSGFFKFEHGVDEQFAGERRDDVLGQQAALEIGFTPLPVPIRLTEQARGAEPVLSISGPATIAGRAPPNKGG